VRDREDGDVRRELAAERRLDHRVRLVVDRGRRLVEDEHLALAHERAREREDLALAHGQVPAAARDRAVEPERRGAVRGLVRLQREQARGAQRVVERRVVALSERIQVLAQRAAEQLRLWGSVSTVPTAESTTERTICGMIVMFSRRFSRFIADVGRPS
jgi:hypothetical protein